MSVALSLPPGLRPPTQKVWRLLAHDAAAIDRLSRLLRVPPIVAQLLLNRKVHDPAQAQKFLTSPLSGLHEPELLPGVPEAVELLMAAVQDRKLICVYGDYDVDGVTGTAILLTALQHLGGRVEFHVPHRLEDGYGLNSATLTSLAQRGVQVIVTVDCGIASVAEAEVARNLGLQLIVTDHHEPKDTYPRADVLVHPRLPTNGATPPYPFGSLSGAGVAFKLAWALCKKSCGSAKVTPVLREFLLDAVALAALGTVADVVPLFDENRIFVRHGLARLRTRPCLGLQALLRTAKLDTKPNLGAVDIGYGLAPRLNAAGRLGTAKLAVELLTTASPQRASILADHLETQNLERQTIERRIMQEARILAESEGDAPALVLASSEWHPGLLGIVASRLVDLFARPVLMIALREGQVLGQGSGRSIPGFRLHEALQECTDRLISHGGHATAAGFRIVPDLIPTFREEFCLVARRLLGDTPLGHRLTVDAEIPLSALTTGLLNALEQLEPYGSGNPSPVFLAGPVQVVGEPRKVGVGERHLSFRVKQEGKFLKAIAFGMGDRAQELMSAGGACCIAFTPRFNEHNGWKTIELDIRDFQAGSIAKLG